MALLLTSAMCEPQVKICKDGKECLNCRGGSSRYDDSEAFGFEIPYVRPSAGFWKWEIFHPCLFQSFHMFPCHRLRLELCKGFDDGRGHPHHFSGRLWFRGVAGFHPNTSSFRGLMKRMQSVKRMHLGCLLDKQLGS